LSPAFFRKEWPKRELDAAFTLEIHHGKKILPVLHDLDFQTLAMTAPLLADKLGVSTSSGIDVVAREILRAIGRPVTQVTPPRDVFEHPERLVGTTISGYFLKNHVGSGGSGMVFLGSHPQYRQDLAIKVFFPLRQGFQHLIGLFQRGFRAVQAVRHPAVVAVLDSGYAELAGRRTTFLATEFVVGSPLDEWVPPDSKQGGYLERLRVTWELANALAACHGTTFVDEFGFQVRGVLHGDVKPANVLVDTEGHPRLLDFLQVDVQRLIDPRIVAPELIEPDMRTGAFGTPGFMAPEQERHGVVTEATDIFGFGVTLGIFLGQSWNPLRVLQNELVGREVKELLVAMISHDPAQRPRRMTEIEWSLGAIYYAERRRLTNECRHE